MIRSDVHDAVRLNHYIRLVDAHGGKGWPTAVFSHAVTVMATSKCWSML